MPACLNPTFFRGSLPNDYSLSVIALWFKRQFSPIHGPKTMFSVRSEDNPRAQDSVARGDGNSIVERP